MCVFRDLYFSKRKLLTKNTDRDRNCEQVIEAGSLNRIWTIADKYGK